MAANIQEAINDVTDDMATKSVSIPAFNAAFAVWFNEMFVEASFPAPGAFWDAQNAGNRTVYDWAVPTKYGQNQFIEIGNLGIAIGPEILSQGIPLVLAVLTGVQQATIRGDITADQETSVVNAYNDAWT
jgi:hypothetical protein